MPTRDEQEFEQRRQQIMDGALRVFSTKGFEKATNKEIAAAAGVGSPGLIYHYFQDKADLFRSLVEERIPALQLIRHSDELMGLPPREALTRFALAFTGTLSNRTTVAMLRLVVGEALRRPDVVRMMSNLGPVPALAFLRRYLEQQMDAGTLRRTDPAIAARMFIGPLVAYALTKEFFHLADAEAIDPEAMARESVETFLYGMALPPPP